MFIEINDEMINFSLVKVYCVKDNQIFIFFGIEEEKVITFESICKAMDAYVKITNILKGEKING